MGGGVVRSKAARGLTVFVERNGSSRRRRVRRGSLLPVVIRASLALVCVNWSMAFARQARAAGETEGRALAAPESVLSDAWGMRLNSSVGGALVPYSTNASGAVRVGVDAEYWLSRNFGLGAQLGFAWLSTIDVGYFSASGHTTRVSLAPSIAIRGSAPTSFPLLSLALGYALGASEEDYYCEFSEGTCNASRWTGGGSGPFASLLVAWVFHPGPMHPGSAAFALGPLARVDWFGIGEGPQRGALVDAFSYFGWVFTAGITAGFGMMSRVSP
jgi:hypothetical protein